MILRPFSEELDKRYQRRRKAMPQVRRRSGDMGTSGAMQEPVEIVIKNAVTKRKDGPTQVKTLPNARSDAHAVGPMKVRNAVSGPKR